MQERRVFTRIKMYAGVLITRGEQAWLTEVTNVSAGGASVLTPTRWEAGVGMEHLLYFILEQERILCIRGTVTHEHDDSIGFEFAADHRNAAEELLAASSEWS